MHCIFCLKQHSTKVNNKYCIFYCKECKAQFKTFNNQIIYLFLYHENFRLCFVQYPAWINQNHSTVCWLEIAASPFLWKFITHVPSSIIKLPIHDIHKKIDSISNLIGFI